MLGETPQVRPPHAKMWWIARLLTTRRPLQERMVLFWHNHFATSASKVPRAELMILQNETFRRLALGSFREMLLAVSRDPAMLLWAEYICTKLFRFFAYDNPEPAVIRALTKAYFDSGYHIGVVVKQILLSEAFLSPRAVRSMVKSPMDFVVGTLRCLGIGQWLLTVLQAETLPQPALAVLRFADQSMQRMEMSLFYPPSVKGWDWGTAWINSATMTEHIGLHPAFAQALQQIAQLIAANTGTRVFYCSTGGFDTHAQQARTHATLLQNFAEGLSAFWADLQAMGKVDKVLVLAFSEFGRRVAENGSAGTDHGAAAPMFAIGKKIQAGLLGEHPSLQNLQDGDLRYHIDFRSVYAAALED
ncbi:MAG: DUF1800 family protein [Armatimonadota bacterium]